VQQLFVGYAFLSAVLANSQEHGAADIIELRIGFQCQSVLLAWRSSANFRLILFAAADNRNSE
jgi:hypothetical protein